MITSLFSVVENMTESANVKNHLAKIGTSGFQRKMNFTPYLTKQAQVTLLVKNFKIQSPISDFQS